MCVDLLSYFLTATKREALHLLWMSQISRYLSVSSPNSRRLRDKSRKPKLPLRDLKCTKEGSFRCSWSRGFRMDKPFMARGLFLLDNGYCPPSLKKENREIYFEKNIGR
jgi:hypothetical protein